jgi:hypothetical protein
MVNSNRYDKGKQTLKDAELIKQFKQLDKFPEDEKKSISRVLNALIGDFNVRQAYML